MSLLIVERPSIVPIIREEIVPLPFFYIVEVTFMKFLTDGMERNVFFSCDCHPSLKFFVVKMDPAHQINKNVLGDYS